MAIEHLKCGEPELRCATSIKYTTGLVYIFLKDCQVSH